MQRLSTQNESVLLSRVLKDGQLLCLIAKITRFLFGVFGSERAVL